MKPSDKSADSDTKLSLRKVTVKHLSSVRTGIKAGDCLAVGTRPSCPFWSEPCLHSFMRQ